MHTAPQGSRLLVKRLTAFVQIGAAVCAMHDMMVMGPGGTPLIHEPQLQVLDGSHVVPRDGTC